MLKIIGLRNWSQTRMERPVLEKRVVGGEWLEFRLSLRGCEVDGIHAKLESAVMLYNGDDEPSAFRTTKSSLIS
jgi:hypothetical protein